jgi:dolichol-phosphate mannosyltransferase
MVSHPAADASPKAVSVVVPTYKEAASLPRLIARVAAVRDAHDLDLELIISDDNSRDGSEEVVRDAGHPWVRMLVRTADRGLSPAVLDGLRLARHDWLFVMDADLSHPPEKIPEMLAALEDGADFALGSRYVAGGSTDAAWGIKRWLNSKVATFLARPFSSTRDPMSGFFALRRQTFLRGDDLNPIGYKIALELLVKCRCQRIVEVPIHFADRQAGESKLNVREQVKYMLHLRRLLIFKYPNRSYMLQFAIVGASGTAVNLAALTTLLAAGTREGVAVAGGIFISLLTNFVLNRRYTFGYARGGNALTHFLGFAGASALGMFVNYGATFLFHHHLAPAWPIQAAALFGIACGMGLNFVTSRYLVFRKPRTTQPDVRDISARI